MKTWRNLIDDNNRNLTFSLLGTYRRTCGLVGVDVVKILGNGVKIT